VLTAALLLLSVAPTWQTEFDTALKAAAAQEKRVFVYVLDSV
jgi:hypothetical protein